MAKYIHKGKVVENNQPIDEILRSYLLKEQEYAHVIMSEQMVEHWQANPNASVEEIFNLGKDINGSDAIQNDEF